MPELKSVDAATDTFQLKHSKVTVVMRRHRSGRDRREAIQATIGEGYNARHAYNRYLCYLAAALMVSWDATRPDAEGDQQPIPISPQSLAAIKDDEDYEQVIEEAAKRDFLENTTPTKKPRSEASSTASSQATSRTRKRLKSSRA